MIVALEQALAPADFGDKAVRLGQLRAAGLPVPDGACLSTAALGRLDDPALYEAIARAVSRLGDPLAVRSSAVGEDGVAASFAGVHESRLGVSGAPAVLDALREVAASVRSPAAAAYRARRGIAAAPCMAALVQRMIPADVAGVAFTRHPVTGAPGFVIEASWGLGEAHVAGLVTPDHFELDREGTELRRVVGDKDVMLVAEGGAIHEREVGAARRRAPCLSGEDLASIVALARRCEALLGAPQDIEWALAGARCWLLQSRPITTIG
jgi:pyruvate,water dikinase